MEGDLYGQTTHGLALALPCLAILASGDMAREGEAEIIARTAAAGIALPVAWQGATRQADPDAPPDPLSPPGGVSAASTARRTVASLRSFSTFSPNTSFT